MSRKLLNSAAVAGSMTFLSRIMGLARDVVMSAYFETRLTDAFLIAFKIPNFFRRMFAEASFSYAFVPVLTEYKTKRTPEETKQLVDRVAGMLASALFLVTLVGMLCAPLLIMIFAPTWPINEKEKFSLASTMLVLTFPYLLFISLTAFAGGILNTYQRFAVPAFTPVLLNVCMIATVVWISPHMANPVLSLAWGVFFAGIAQLLFQIPFLMQIGLLPRFRWDTKHEGVRRIGRLMVPTLISASILQLSLVIDQWMATALVSGSVSWLFYSDRLVEFPLGIFGIALATVILPSLSKSFSDSSMATFRQTMDWGLRWVVFISIPAALGLLLLAGPMVSTVYFRGTFKFVDVQMTTWALMAYSVGLIGFILVKVLSPGFYSRQNTKIPMIAAVRALYWKLIISLLLLNWYLRDQTLGGFFGIHFDVGGHSLLAFATAVSAFINSYLLYRVLRAEQIYIPGPGWALDLLRISMAAMAMTAAILLVTPDLADWTDWHWEKRLWRLLAYVSLGFAVYIATALLLGLRPFRWKSHA